MLYRGSEVTREVAWVVFDEIHYMRDKGGYLAKHCAFAYRLFAIFNRFSASNFVLRLFMFSTSLLCREGGRLGGNNHPSAGQRSLCVSIRHHSECKTVCRVDLPPTQ